MAPARRCTFPSLRVRKSPYDPLDELRMPCATARLSPPCGSPTPRGDPAHGVTELLEVPNEGCAIGASFRFDSIFWCKRFNTVNADFTGLPSPFVGGGRLRLILGSLRSRPLILSNQTLAHSNTIPLGARPAFNGGEIVGRERTDSRPPQTWRWRQTLGPQLLFLSLQFLPHIAHGYGRQPLLGSGDWPVSAD